LESTDNQCQFCHHNGTCLASTEVCNPECVLSTSKETCTDEDCQWCPSSQQCTEKRIECVDCSSYGSSDCEGDDHPGCKLCDIGLCVGQNEQCLTCEGRGKDVCGSEGDTSLNCMWCYSLNKCVLKSTECTQCSTLNSTDACGSYSGCAFCESDQVCMNSDDNLAECDCSGLSIVSCKAHGKGCCFSTTTNACYPNGDDACKAGVDTTVIIAISVTAGVLVAAAAVIIPVAIFCCKPKNGDGIEMTAPGTIVVLPEGQPSMVVQESLQSVNVDPATAASVDETATGVGLAPSTSVQDMQNMQNMIAQQQMLNTMMAQQQMSMMMNPMMMNSMGMMNMSGMAGMSGMNSMGMDMNSMNMTGGMNSMNMTGGMMAQDQQQSQATQTQGM